LILFSDINGVYSDNPKTTPDAKLIETVESIPELRKSIKIGDTNAFGTGGMETKIQAAEKVTEYGIEMLLANGGKTRSLAALFEDDAKATLFTVK
jgi:glutamate 5-kinase